MKENYEIYAVEESLDDIKTALDCICELLEKFLERGEEVKEKEKEKAKTKAAEFRPAKIGAEIGEEKSQMDVIAKIFGNQ